MVMPRSLTDAQVQEMLALHQAGFPMTQLAGHFKVSTKTVCKWLRTSGANTHRLKATPERVDEWIELYEADCSTYEISTYADVTEETVRMALVHRGIARKPVGPYRTKTLHENAFDVLTDESAYWLGILATDGCVTGSEKLIDIIALTLKLDDITHVELLRSFMGSNHKMRLWSKPHPTDPSKMQDFCSFKVRSKHMTATLATYGIIPRKTFTLVAKGGVENLRSYWRGVYDGDGTLGIACGNGPFCNLTSASEPFVVQCRDYLKANGVRGEHSITIVHPDENSLATHDKYVLRLGARAALDAVSLLYVDGAPALARKSQLAHTMLQRGMNKELVGTIRTNWYDSKAAVWAGLALQ